MNGLHPDDIEDLAAVIRRVDGNHSLGAAALAEALLPFLASRGFGTRRPIVEEAAFGVPIAPEHREFLEALSDEAEAFAKAQAAKDTHRPS